MALFNDTTAQQLDAAVRAVSPNIDGVHIGNPADKTTWGIWFQPSATPAERSAAQTVMQGFTAG